MATRARSQRSRTSTPQSPGSLRGQVALVAGATRGAGRGIARALGEAGATVVCTGRSVAGRPSPYGRPETVDETAALIAAAGGRAIALRVDHTVEAEVEALVAKIMQDYGRLDVLVNSIAGEEPLMGQWGSFWQVDVAHADQVLRQSLVSHIITAKHAAPHLIRKRRGLIVEVTENDVLGGGGNPLAWSVKLAIKGLALNMATELHAHHVTSVAITPGFLRSEAMLEGMGVTDANWPEAGKKDPNFLESESPVVRGPRGRGDRAGPADVRPHGTAVELVGAQSCLRIHGHRRAEAGLGHTRDRLFGPAPVVPGGFCTGLALQTEWLTRLQEHTARMMSNLPPPAPERTARRVTKRARNATASSRRRG